MKPYEKKIFICVVVLFALQCKIAHCQTQKGMARINKECFIFDEEALENKIAILNEGTRINVDDNNEDSTEITYEDNNIKVKGYVPKDVVISETSYSNNHENVSYTNKRIIVKEDTIYSGEKTTIYRDKNFTHVVGVFKHNIKIEYSYKDDVKYYVRYKTNNIDVRGFIKTVVPKTSYSSGKKFTTKQLRRLKHIKELIEKQKEKIKTGAKRYGYTKKSFKCTRCKGTGKITKKYECKVCKGSGRVYKKVKTNVFNIYKQKAQKLVEYEEEVNAITPDNWDHSRIISISLAIPRLTK